jgi:hypothetical protein
MSKYLVVVTCKETLSEDSKMIMCKEGEEVVLCNGEWGETYHNTDYVNTISSTDCLLFDFIDDAVKFMDDFEDHPWYYNRKNYRVVEAIPMHTVTLSGWTWDE